MMNGHHQPYIQAAIEGEISRLASAVTGERNDVLFKATASLASLGIREGEILRCLRPAAEKIGLRGSEIYSTVKSGVKAGRDNPRHVPDSFRKAPNGVMPSPKVWGELPPRSAPDAGGQQPKFVVGSEDGPSVSADEERRHIYRHNGNPVRVKIKRRGGRYVNWYRVTGANDGWQAGKPDGYEPCPYTGAFDAFDPEFRTELLYWPEGEKDCDTLSREGMPAFTQSAGTPGRNRSTFNLAADLLLLEREIERHGDVALVIIDPLSSYMLNVDSHRNTDVRAVLEPMEEMAERLRVAILATTHLSKGDGKAINRIIGSIAFVAAARAVFTVVEDPDEQGRRLLLHVKNNIARPQPGLAFHLEQREIVPGILGSAVAWDETASISVTADQALLGIGGQSSTKGDAVEFLLDVLSGGPMEVREIEQHAVSASLLTEGKPIGQSKPFRLARGQLGIQPRRSGGLAGSGRWVWELPNSKMPAGPYDAPVPDEGTLSSDGHLSDTDRG
jgi:hypothetical protein